VWVGLVDIAILHHYLGKLVWSWLLSLRNTIWVVGRVTRAVYVDSPRVLFLHLFQLTWVLILELLEVRILVWYVWLLSSWFLRGPPWVVCGVSLRVLAEHESILWDTHHLAWHHSSWKKLLRAGLPLHLKLLQLLLQLQRLLLLVRRETVVAVSRIIRALHLTACRHQLLLRWSLSILVWFQDTLVLALKKNVLVWVWVFPAEEPVLGVSLHCLVDHSLLRSGALTLGEMDNALVTRLGRTFLRHLIHRLVVVSLASLLVHLLVHFLLLVVQNRVLA